MQLFGVLCGAGSRASPLIAGGSSPLSTQYLFKGSVYNAQQELLKTETADKKQKAHWETVVHLASMSFFTLTLELSSMQLARTTALFCCKYATAIAESCPAVPQVFEL